MDSLVHITAEQKQHINELASKKASSLNMNPKKNAYVLLGHGGDQPLEKIRVPDGCIVVVKAHSGDTILAEHFNINLSNITFRYNTNIVLNPNANKVALYGLLSEKDNHSVAIYNEKEEINDLYFQPLMYFNTMHEIQYPSGFLRIDSNPREVSDYYTYKTFKFNNEAKKAFSKINDKLVLNTLEGMNIWDLFLDNSIYEYYYTKRHIKDICNGLTFLANYPVEPNQDIKPLYDEFNNMCANYFRLKYVTPVFNYVVYKINPNASRFLEVLSILISYTQEEFIGLITNLLTISLSTIFEDINSGLIPRGIFYNLSCRATELTNIKLKNNKGVAIDTLPVVLNEKGREKFPEHMVHNIIPERRNRISEAEFHRKNQIRQVRNKFRAFKEFSFRPHTGEREQPTNEYKQYEKNSKNTNKYTYKKQNGKWLRYKKGILWNTKNAPNNKNLRQAINTSQNERNYVQVNGKWKTRKWNNATGKYILQNNTRKNNKFSEMANKSRARRAANLENWNIMKQAGFNQRPGTERQLGIGEYARSEMPANILGQ